MESMERKSFLVSMCTRIIVSERPPLPFWERVSEPSMTRFMLSGSGGAVTVVVDAPAATADPACSPSAAMTSGSTRELEEPTSLWYQR